MPPELAIDDHLDGIDRELASDLCDDCGRWSDDIKNVIQPFLFRLCPECRVVDEKGDL